MVGYSNSWNTPGFGNLCTPPDGVSYIDSTTAFAGQNYPSTANYEMLITKFDSTGVMKWSTLYGDSSAGVDVVAWSITSDNANRFFVTGKDLGAFQFVANNPSGTYTQTAINQSEGIMLAFNSALNSPIWNTRLGGQKYESGIALKYNPFKNVIIMVGTTNSRHPAENFPIFRDNSLYPNAWYNAQLNFGNLYNDDGYIAHFTMDAIVGLKEYYEDKTIQDIFGLFPNPAQTNVNIAFKEGLRGEVKIEVYNQLGQLVLLDFKKDVAAHSLFNLNIGNLPGGLYIVNVRNGDVAHSKKLIISK